MLQLKFVGKKKKNNWKKISKLTNYDNHYDREENWDENDQEDFEN